MSYELHYTSAPHGLKPGSQGFCTVKSTRGMPALLVEKLEALSVYRDQGESGDGQGPVAVSHFRVSIAGAGFSILTRIAASGLDYSQRKNYFAHHVALSASELPAAGPAWLASQPGFLETCWDQSVEQLPAGRIPRDGDRPPAICRKWGEVTGDPAWGAVLAERSLSAEPTYVIFDPGADILGLFVESLTLLPINKRWSVTFSTCFTRLPPDVACAWRGVLRNSAEAATACKSAGLVLDLAELRSQSAPMGSLTELARTGRQRRTSRAVVPAVPPQAPDDDVGPLDGGYELIPESAIGAFLSPAAGASRPAVPPAPPPAYASRSRARIWLFVLMSALPILIVGAVIYISYSAGHSQDFGLSQADNATEPNTEQPAAIAKDVKSDPSGEGNIKPAVVGPGVVKPPSRKDPDNPALNEKPAATPKPGTTPKTEQPKKAKVVAKPPKSEYQVLILPPPPPSATASSSKAGKWSPDSEPMKLPIGLPVVLQLLGDLPKKLRLVVQSPEKGKLSIVHADLAQMGCIATFSVKGDTLAFHWDDLIHEMSSRSSIYENLQRCVLEIRSQTTATDFCIVQFRQPIRVDRFPMNRSHHQNDSHEAKALALIDRVLHSETAKHMHLQIKLESINSLPLNGRFEEVRDTDDDHKLPRNDRPFWSARWRPNKPAVESDFLCVIKSWENPIVDIIDPTTAGKKKDKPLKRKGKSNRDSAQDDQKQQSSPVMQDANLVEKELRNGKCVRGRIVDRNIAIDVTLIEFGPDPPEP